VEGGKATVWAATQTPFPARQEVAAALGFPPENVRVITPSWEAGLGGKAAAAVTPLRLRACQDRRKAGPGGLDPGRRVLLRQLPAGGSRQNQVGNRRRRQDDALDYSVYFAGPRSAEQYYDVPNNIMRVYGQWMGPTTAVHPFRVGPWRAPGANINVFARESQIDIMAAKAKVDPLEFRLRNTDDKRMRRSSGWRPSASAGNRRRGPSGRGVGIACRH